MAKQPEETNLIQKYLAPLAGSAGLGLKDDAANLAPKPGMDLVLTADTIVADVHFLAGDNPFDIAVKAITVNLSDLVAKGADPLGYLLALTFPAKPSEKWFEQFTSGLETQISGKLLGGDITVSNGGPLTITVTAIGEVPSGKMIRRYGAGEGDHIFVGGNIGTSAAGLKCAQLCQQDAAKLGLSEEDFGDLVEQYSAPFLAYHKQLSNIIQENATASLDISDGLVIDLNRLCEASGVGAEIAIGNIPLHGAVRRSIDGGAFSLLDAVTGGDDYVPLFTVSPERLEAFMKEIEDLPVTKIGKTLSADKAVTFKYDDGSELSLEGRSGYDHFTND